MMTIEISTEIIYLLSLGVRHQAKPQALDFVPGAYDSLHAPSLADP
jgi:hypothetical protein